ncbi:MAG: alpha/beta fold hydrolase [Gallionellaceae bacterium]|nr:alpha/beta fold hydrolase [Gallionellaceae bacterium]
MQKFFKFIPIVYLQEFALSTSVLILPGFGNSDPQHWQSLWEQANPGFERVRQHDWNNPVCDEWVAVLEGAAQRAGPEVILVAHSLSCLVVAHWATQQHAPIKGALLVAVPDPDSRIFPREAVGFSTVPAQPFTFKSIVVASTDDPYGTTEYAGCLAQAWGSHFVSVGACGHINGSSGIGAWPEGYELLNKLSSSHISK